MLDPGSISDSPPCKASFLSPLHHLRPLIPANATYKRNPKHIRTNATPDWGLQQHTEADAHPCTSLSPFGWSESAMWELSVLAQKSELACSHLILSLCCQAQVKCTLGSAEYGWEWVAGGQHEYRKGHFWAWKAEHGKYQAQEGDQEWQCLTSLSCLLDAHQLNRAGAQHSGLGTQHGVREKYPFTPACSQFLTCHFLLAFNRLWYIYDHDTMNSCLLQI